MKTTQLRSNKVYCSGLTLTRELATIICVWQILKVKQREGKTLQWQKGGCRYGLTGGFWHEEAVGRLTRSRTPNMIG